jgi:hypothetical protein
VLVVIGIIGMTFGGVGIYTVDRLISITITKRELPGKPVTQSVTEDPLGFLRSYLLTPGTYMSTLIILAKFPVGIALFVLLVVPLSIATTLLAIPLLIGSFSTGLGISVPGVFESGFVAEGYTIESEFLGTSGTWIVDTIPEALLLSTLGAALFLLTLNVLNSFAYLYVELTVVLSRYASVFSIDSPQ